MLYKRFTGTKQQAHFCLKQSLLALCLILFCTQSKTASAQMLSQGLNIQFLGDLSLQYPHSKSIPASFVLGDVDIWFQHSFGENLNAIGELLIMNEEGGEGDTYNINPARLFIEYSISEKLKLRLGQLHTAIGLYSQLYPHGGSIFEPSLHRPLLAGVKEGEDILPFHALGFNLRGTSMIGDHLEFMYIVGISNGYSHGSMDTNQQKAPYFQLRLSPLDIMGLTFAFSAYHDLVTKDEIKDGIEQTIMALSIMYDAFPFDILAEGFVMRNASTPPDSFKFFGPSDPDEITLPDGRQPRKQLFGGYLQASYMFGAKHAVFTVLEAFQRDKGDYLFDEHTPYTKYYGTELGHRFHWNQNLVLKSAYNYNWADDLHRFDIQLAFKI